MPKKKSSYSGPKRYTKTMTKKKYYTKRMKTIVPKKVKPKKGRVSK